MCVNRCDIFMIDTEFFLQVDRTAIMWEKEFARILDEYQDVVYYTNTK